jgi:poly(hydroxyalkanoate) depolymerase family esterase
MSNDYVAEILRATASLRSGDPEGVGAVINRALGAAGLMGGAADAPHAFPQAAPRGGRLRRPLGEVLRNLAAGRKALGLGTVPGPGQPPRPVAEPPLPEGARFLELSYASAAGARRYRLYVPASAGRGLQGLLVMLHGCRQAPEDFAAGTGMNALAEARRLIVAWPAQTAADNSLACWNWFRPEDQARDAGEPAIIAGLTRSLRDEYGIPEGRVFVAGLSAGGAMAAVMGETYPELYAAVGVHSGLAFGSASDAASAFAAMRGQGYVDARPAGGGARPRLIVFQGTADTTVHPSNAARLVARHGEGDAPTRSTTRAPAEGRRGYTRLAGEGRDGANRFECWMVEGAPHAWSGGHPGGSYTDPRGPDASAAMVRFFLDGASDAGEA